MTYVFFAAAALFGWCLFVVVIGLIVGGCFPLACQKRGPVSFVTDGVACAWAWWAGL
jgi:hypothetical protein